MVATTLRMHVKGAEADDSSCRAADAVKNGWTVSPSVFQLKVGRKKVALLPAAEGLRNNIQARGSGIYT